MLYEPEKLPPTENIAVCQLHLHTYVVGPMDFFIDFARRAAHALKMPCSGPVYLPTQTTHWTVLRANNCPPSIGMRVTLWEWEELDFSKKKNKFQEKIDD
ncbi:17171_t:CDS:2 [Entrophospora sp. SA101]|nr:17171_t:CDS:2 [Entrophospora sp. SA101]